MRRADTADQPDDVPEEPDEGAAFDLADVGPEPDLHPWHLRPEVDLYVPDGRAWADAVHRTTDLGIGAHPDDLELLMLVPIGWCAGRPDRWFTGVTCTDGRGSVRAGGPEALTDNQLVALRRKEQRRAAEIGGYAAMAQLGHQSSHVRAAERPSGGERTDQRPSGGERTDQRPSGGERTDQRPSGGERTDGRVGLVEDLTALLAAARPVNVYTHDLADRHPTHVAVGLAAIEAIRGLPMADRPVRVVGVEGWRDLDWLPDHVKEYLDATPFTALGQRLVACHASQLGGGKAYDRAIEGRRRAHATMREFRAVDEAEQVSVAMDLTPLIRNDALDPVAYVLAAVDRFRDDVERALRDATHRPRSD